MRIQRTNRTGFTLVELMVATALIIFIMVILAGAFGVATTSLRNLRTAANLAAQLRYAGDIMRRDLAAKHFGGAFESGLSGPYLSDQRMDRLGWKPPQQGFFRIGQGTVPPLEGTDPEGVISSAATDHYLHFTVKLSGTNVSDLFIANIAGTPGNFVGLTEQRFRDFITINENPPGSGIFVTNQMASDWAEIAYFLRPNGTSAGGTPLFSLHRRQRLLGPVGTNVQLANFDPRQFPEISVTQQYLTQQGVTQVLVHHLNTPETITVPVHRLPFIDPGNAAITPSQFPVSGRDIPNRAFAPAPNIQPGNITAFHYDPIGAESNDQPSGDDILLTDVLSMEIKANWVPYDLTSLSRFNATLLTSWPLPVYVPNNRDYPFENLPRLPVNFQFYPGVFDTFTLDPAANNAGGFSTNPTLLFQRYDPKRYVSYEVQNPAFILGDTSFTVPTGNPAPQDTFTTRVNPPLRLRMNAIQIRLRIWDIKAQQARQVTIVQEI